MPDKAAPVVNEAPVSIENQAQETAENITESAVGNSLDEAATPKEVKQAVAAQKAEVKRIKKLRLKIDNRDFDEDLPFEIDDTPAAREYMTRNLQLSKMGQKRAQEKANLETEVIKFINELKTNPKRALSNPNIGVDIKALAKEIIEEEIANMAKTPDQLAKEQLENELKQMKEQRERDKQTSYQQELARMEQQEFQRYDMLVSKALDDQKLPRNPYIVKKMADYMLSALQDGIDAAPEQVAKVVKDEMMGELRSLMDVLPEEVLEEYIGKDILNKIRKRRVATAKTAPPTPLSKSIQDVGRPKDAPKASDGPKKSYKDFFGI